MKKSLFTLFLLALFLGASTRSYAWADHMRTYKSMRIGSKKTPAEVGEAIQRAAKHSNWTVDRAGNDSVIASFRKGKYKATVEIPYDSKEYSIRYQASEGFGYDRAGGKISAQYNIWIANLQHAIAAELN